VGASTDSGEGETDFLVAESVSAAAKRKIPFKSHCAILVTAGFGPDSFACVAQVAKKQNAQSERNAVRSAGRRRSRKIFAAGLRVVIVFAILRGLWCAASLV
jgi:hypothetical protein